MYILFVFMFSGREKKHQKEHRIYFSLCEEKARQYPEYVSVSKFNGMHARQSNSWMLILSFGTYRRRSSQ
jgi:hypothetical protein